MTDEHLRRPRYEVIYMLPGGETVIRHRDGSPPPQSLYFYRPRRSVYFTRYYPMTKRWRVYDLRLFHEVSVGRSLKIIVPPPTVLLDDKDAAVMWMGLNV